MQEKITAPEGPRFPVGRLEATSGYTELSSPALFATAAPQNLVIVVIGDRTPPPAGVLFLGERFPILL